MADAPLTVEVNWTGLPVDLVASIMDGINAAATRAGYDVMFREETGLGRIYFHPASWHQAALDVVQAGGLRRGRRVTAELDGFDRAEAMRAWNAFIDSWLAVRDELAAIERAEHPDVTDGFGRVWEWWKGDLYRHDGCLVIPKRWISQCGLPSSRLVANPNYAGLCGACRQDPPTCAT